MHCRVRKRHRVKKGFSPGMKETSPTVGKRSADIYFGALEGGVARVRAAMQKTSDYLFSTQHEDGYWAGELEADTTLESDYIMVHTLLGTAPETEREERNIECAREILRHQNEDGGWPIYHGGPSNISASVKAYFALKLAGLPQEHPALERAKKKILEMGGVTEVNTFTKIY